MSDDYSHGIFPEKKLGLLDKLFTSITKLFSGKELSSAMYKQTVDVRQQQKKKEAAKVHVQTGHQLAVDKFGTVIKVPIKQEVSFSAGYHEIGGNIADGRLITSSHKILPNKQS